MIACKKNPDGIKKSKSKLVRKKNSTKKTLRDITLDELQRIVSTKKIEEESQIVDEEILKLLFRLIKEKPEIEISKEKKSAQKEDLNESFMDEKRKRVISDISDVYSRRVDGSYGMQHEMNPAFYTSKVDYNELFSHMGAARSKAPPRMYSGESFKQTGHIVEHQMGAMTYEDGFSMVNRMNISSTLQVYDNVSAEEKERFEHWKMFNKHMRRFYDTHTVVNGTRTGASFKPMLKELKT